MIGLIREMTYRLKPTGPMARTLGSPRGVREYWQMNEAELVGDRIRAHAPFVGGDWMTVGPDGWNRPDVRVQFETDDGAVVLLHYTGLVQPSAAFNAAAEAGGSTGFDDQVMRMAMTFDCGAPGYEWLNQSLFIAQGRLQNRWIEYDVYRVT